jgi:DNA-directed RNA polymerase subunit RPC12/RpoP
MSNTFKLKKDPRTSKFIADNIYVEGRKIDFNLYEPMKFVYDLEQPELLILAGRQIGKSVYLASKAATKSILVPHNRILYVSPLEAQAKTWSKTKLNPIIMDSPYIKAFFKRSGNNVFFKENMLGSYIELTYASLTSEDPQRVRGKSADDLFIDETQDIQAEALPVIKETITSSLRPTVTYAGTAKSKEALTGVIWNKATKIERVYKCTGCNKYNTIHYENISEKGLVCKYCGKKLDQSKSSFAVVEKNSKSRYVAVRLPQVIMPIHQTEIKWYDIWAKYQDYSKEKFQQEVLGLPSGAGTRFLTLEDLKKNCMEGKRMRNMIDNEIKNKYIHIFMGIDWGGEGQEDKSRTAYGIFGHKKGTGDIEVLGAGIIPAGDPKGTLEKIKNIGIAFRVDFFGADAGMGAYQNSILQAYFGVRKFLQVRYTGNNKPYQYDSQANILNINKTAAIDTYMGILKQDMYFPLLKKVMNPKAAPNVKNLKIIFPIFEDSYVYFKDIMAEFTQTTKAGNKIWTHNPDVPDDFLHAGVFGLMAYTFFKTGQVAFY